MQFAYAQAQPAAARACANCHGARGEGGSTGAPPLAGQSREYLLVQLEAYADGRRQHSVMTAVARALQPAEREALAVYFATFKALLPPPQVGFRKSEVAVHKEKL